MNNNLKSSYPSSTKNHESPKQKQILEHFINTEVVITERITWHTMCLTKDQVYNTWTNGQTRIYVEKLQHEIFSKVAKWLSFLWEVIERYNDSGPPIFILSTILSDNKVFMSWKETLFLAEHLKIKVSPTLFSWKFKSTSEVETFIRTLSRMRPDLTEFIIRRAEEIKIEKMFTDIAIIEIR